MHIFCLVGIFFYIYIYLLTDDDFSGSCFPHFRELLVSEMYLFIMENILLFVFFFFILLFT